MMDAAIKASERATELVLPGGCLLCGGDLPVRLTPAGAYACCNACRWISRPKVQMSRKAIRVAHAPAGWA